MTMDVMFMLLTLIVSGLGAYLGSYLKKKGENLATHEDIDKLLAQVTATKEIEAKISVDVWERQKKWEIKKDALLETVKELAIARDALTTLESEWQASRLYLSQEAAAGRNPDMAITWDRIVDATHRFREASASFQKASELANLVCDLEVKRAFAVVHGSMLQVAMDISQKPNALGETTFKLIQEMNNLTATIRRELGIPMTGEEGQAGAFHAFE